MWHFVIYVRQYVADSFNVTFFWRTRLFYDSDIFYCEVAFQDKHCTATGFYSCLTTLVIFSGGSFILMNDTVIKKVKNSVYSSKSIGNTNWYLIYIYHELIDTKIIISIDIPQPSKDMIFLFTIIKHTSSIFISTKIL